MKAKFITIEREYGSGGTEIAHRVAKKSGVPCYGKEILEEAAKEQHVSVQKIMKYEESTTGSFLYSLFLMGKAQSGSADMVSEEGRVFLAEQDVIRRFAAKGPAVFLGHCAAEALKERQGVVHVFIRSNLAERKRRIQEEYGIPKQDVESTMKRFDQKRANYYAVNTSKQWRDANNYDVILDSSRLGVESCANLLSSLLPKGNHTENT